MNPKKRVKRCPKCRSMKWRENQSERGKWKCFKCGFEWWNPRYWKPVPINKEESGGRSSSRGAKYHKPVSMKGQRIGGVNSNAIPLIDHHANVFKLPIKKDNEKVHLPIITKKKMRGWRAEWIKEKDFKIMRTPKSIVIFLSKRFKKPYHEIGNVEDEVLNHVMRIKKDFEIKYKMKLGKPIPIKKDVKLLEGFRSAVQFQSKKVKCVYPDGRIEFIDPKDAVSHTTNFIENLSLESKADAIQTLLVDQNRNIENQIKVTKMEIKNKQLHQAVLIKMENRLGQLGGSVRKLNRTMSEWKNLQVKRIKKKKIQKKLNKHAYMKKWRKKHPHYHKAYMVERRRRKRWRSRKKHTK